ncbi:MAG: SDR family oxidoreductase [Actinomycetota bacterium]|nr:SDR family oxidoreductase [Actinomycetota bacterium]
MRVLVTGATGYIGGRLVPELLAAGYQVRAMTRSEGWLRDVAWAGQVEACTADVLDEATLPSALAGVDVAYYLIHSIGSGANFADRDRQAATSFARAAAAAGVRRIVYLGGLSDKNGAGLSEHLASRAEVGRILLNSGVPTAVLRAAMIIGSGSASFEMLRYLTERLPVMITPRWVGTRIQPIAVRDVLRYLVGCAKLPPELNRGFDIGGPDILTYRDMMLGFAEVAGLRRRIVVPVPFLTPGLSSHWVGLITPVPSVLAKPLIRSLTTEVVTREHDIARYVPDPDGGLLPFDRAIALALQRVQEARVTTRWSEGEWEGAPSDPLPTDPHWAGGTLYADDRTRVVSASRERVWSVIEAIGGANGWYSFPLAWTVRGVLDRAVGGVGLRRGRRDAAHLRVGDALDWWRVEAIEPGRLLRLRAEMRVPGLAWLEYALEDASGGGTEVRQRATFYPRGLAGRVYWQAIKPFHAFVFAPMLRNLAATAEAGSPVRAG